MKNKFYRYYFLNMQFAIVMVFIQVLTMIAPLSALISGDGISIVLFFQICVIAPLIPSFLYACFGCYWAFQKVVINSDGIEIWFFKRCIKKYTWNSILKVENSYHNRFPALKITLQNDDVFYLERRRPIIRAIEFNFDKPIGREMDTSITFGIQRILRIYKIYKTVDSYMEFNKSYIIFIYWKTDKELDLITDTVKQEIRKTIINHFSGHNLYPNVFEDVIIYFDSDENVQKNHAGDYFYVTR